MAYLPAHQWNFDEIDGSVARDSTGAVNGTLVNAQRVSPGYVGLSSVHIDGSNGSFVDFTNRVGQFGTADFTVAFWIDTSDASLPLCDLIGNRTADSHGNFFCVRMRQNGIVTFEVDQDGAGTNYASVAGTTSVNDGRWHHVAVVRQSGTITLYIDGQPVGSGQGKGIANIANGNPLKLGRSVVFSAPRYAPNAVFDDVRIYDSALDARDITSMISWSLPDEVRLVLATGMFQTGDKGNLSAAHEQFLTLAADGGLTAKATDRSAAAVFEFTVNGKSIAIATGGKFIQIASDGTLKATGASVAAAAQFYPYLLESGDLIWSSSTRLVWQLGDDLKVSAINSGRTDIRNEFTLGLDAVAPGEQLMRLNADQLEDITACDLAWASFVWQLTGGLFFALGLGPFISNGQVQTGMLAILRNNPTAWAAVQGAMATMATNPGKAASAAVVVLGAIWRGGLLRAVVAFAISSLGWWALFRIIAKLLELILAPELEAVDLLASFTIWSAQTVNAALNVKNTCGMSDKTIAAMTKA